MTYFDRLKNAKPKSTGKSAGKAVAETFVVSVTGYENVDDANEQNRLVVGTRLDTGEEVRVYLRKDENPGKFARHGVLEFSSYAMRKPPKSATEIGGDIRFDGAFPDKDRAGVWSANWGVPTAHYKGEARSVRTYVRVNKANIKEEGQGKSSITVDVVKNNDAVVVKSFDELRAKLVEALTPVNEGNGAVFAVVRAFAASGEVVSLEAYAKKDEEASEAARQRNADHRSKKTPGYTPEREYVYKTPEGSAAEFLDEDTTEALKGILQSSDEKVEVMRGTRFFVGRQTVDTAQEKGRIGEFDKRWRFPDNQEANGFVDAWVTLRHLMDARGNPVTPTTLIVTHVGAATSSSPVVGFEELPSPAALGRDVTVQAPAASAAPAEAAPVAEQRQAAPAPAPVAAAAQDDGPDLTIVDDVSALEVAQQNYQKPARSNAPTPF